MNGTSVSNGTRPSPINISHRSFRNILESFGKWKTARKNSHWKKTLEFQFFSYGEGRGKSLFLSSTFGFQSSATLVSIFQQENVGVYEFKLRV